MKKSLLAVTLSMVILFSHCLTYAEPIDKLSANNLAPYQTARFSTIHNIMRIFKITSDGKANIGAQIDSYSPDYTCKIVATVQYQSGSSWIDYLQMSKSDSWSACINNRTNDLPAGRNYRCRFDFYVYEGSTLLESTSATVYPN